MHNNNLVGAVSQPISGASATEIALAVGSILACPALHEYLPVGDDDDASEDLPAMPAALAEAGHAVFSAAWDHATRLRDAGTPPTPLLVAVQIDKQVAADTSYGLKLACPGWREELGAHTAYWAGAAFERVDVEDARALVHKVIQAHLVHLVQAKHWEIRRNGGEVPPEHEEWMWGIVQRLELLRRGDSQVEWPDPLPLTETTLISFPVATLPDALRAWVNAVSTVLQVPVDLPAMLALGLVGSTGAKIVEVRLRPDWTEPVNLYNAIVMPPGCRKSPVFRLAMAPLKQWDRDEAARTAPFVRRYEAELNILQNRQKKVEKSPIKDAFAHDACLRESTGITDQIARLTKYVQPTRFCDDVTPEKLAIIMAEQGGRICLAASEGTVIKQMTGLYSGKAQTKIYLDGYDGGDVGQGRVKTDRPDVDIERPALSLIVTVQPGVLRGLGVKYPELLDTGLLARFCFSSPASWVGYRKPMEKEPAQISPAVTAGYQGLMWAACKLHNPYAPSFFPGGGVHELRLSDAADDAFIAYHNAWEISLREFDSEDHFAGWLKKLAGTVGRLAGILHLAAAAGADAALTLPVHHEPPPRTAPAPPAAAPAETTPIGPAAAPGTPTAFVAVPVVEAIPQPAPPPAPSPSSRPPSFAPWTTEISGDTMRSAIKIGEYLRPHAAAAFELLASGTTAVKARWEDVWAAADWITRGQRRTFTRRELYRSERKRFPRANDVNPVIAILTDHHWVRQDEETSKKDYRPSEIYVVNPRLFDRGRPATAQPGNQQKAACVNQQDVSEVPGEGGLACPIT